MIKPGEFMENLARDNHEPSSGRRRCRDYSERKYIQVDGSAWDLTEIMI